MMQFLYQLFLGSDRHKKNSWYRAIKQKTEQKAHAHLRQVPLRFRDQPPGKPGFIGYPTGSKF